MAAAGATHSRKCFRLPVSNINAVITEGDIIETGAEAIVTGEDKNMEGHGRVSQLLLKKCPKAYKSAREQLKKTTKKFDVGKVYVCDLPNPAVGDKKSVSFSMVLHAIVPSAKTVTNPKDWTGQMTKLYYYLLKMANARGKTSLALPLLGSGGAGATVDVAVDALAKSLMTFKPDRVTRQQLKDVIVYVRKDAFSKLVHRMAEKQKSSAAVNGVVQHTSPRSDHDSDGRQRPINPRSGKGSATNPHESSEISRTRGSAWATAVDLDVNTEEKDYMSNLSFILQNTTLDQDRACKGEDEEDMDCADFELVQHEDVCEVQEEESKSEEDKGEEEEEEKCAICLDVMDNPKKLDKCGHTFCTVCIEDSFKHHKPACPTCNMLYAIVTGNQPPGTMSAGRHPGGLPGYENCGQIIIDYQFPNGIQGKEHPNPGQAYHGTFRRAFLPDCPEGRKVYRLLRVAFDFRLTFTVGQSVTTGRDNVVTWNDIHHKTRPDGGATGFGYPDPLYLSRVQEELAAKGVTEQSLEGRSFDI